MDILENKIEFTDYNGTPVENEDINRSDTTSFILENDTFYEDSIEIWTSPDQSGIKLAKGTDYELYNLNKQLTNEAGKNVYTRLAITNPDYLGQDLYGNYTTLGNFTSFKDLQLLEQNIKSDEDIQDIVNSLLQSSGATNISYDDENNTLTISSTDTDTQRTDEEIQDMIGSFISAGNNISLNYDDVNNELAISSDATNDYIKDGFNDFVKDAKVHGGVEYIEKEETLINSDFSISETFTGTGVMLITQVDSTSKTIDATVDGSTSTITIPSADIDQNNVLIELQTGLAYDEHSITVDNASDIVEVIGFAVIKSSDRTSQNDSGVSYIDSERAEITSQNQSFTTPTSGRCDLVTMDKQGNTNIVEGTDGAEEKVFRVEEDGTISREYVGDIPGWLTDVNVWHSEITGDYATGWVKDHSSSKSNKYYLYSQSEGEFYIEFIGTGIDLVYRTHSTDIREIEIFIDGISSEIYDFNTGTDVEQAIKNLASGLDFGYHEIRIVVDPNNNNNNICHIDAFDIYTPATPDLPTDTQALAKAYPMPAPATMSSIPARPTSAEEKGWQRIESDEGCRYVGSGWVDAGGVYTSAGIGYRTGTANDYVEFDFIGDAIRVINRYHSNNGEVAISVDGSSETLIDLRQDGDDKIVIYENTSLDFRKHTIKMRLTNTYSGQTYNYMFSDAFEVHQPLHITDTRTLSPIQENSAYEIDYDSKLNKPLPSSVGGQLDRLEQMENVTKIENSDGIAYLYPDGRAELYLEIEKSSVDGQTTYGQYIVDYPIILSEIVNGSISVSSNYHGGNDGDASKTTLRLSTLECLFTAIINKNIPVGWFIKFFINVNGRWY